MHDFHLAEKILKTVLDYATSNSLKGVFQIKIELGQLTEHGQEITPENLQFNFSLLAKGTPAEKAKLLIKKVPGSFWRLKEIRGS